MTDQVGLAGPAARLRLAEFGPNLLPESTGPARMAILASQFRNPMVALLGAAAAVSAAVGDSLDAGVILLIVILNTLLGYLQEEREEVAAREVRKLLAPRARVIRDGQAVEIPAEEVVPGDLAALAAGDRIPADGHWLDAAAVEVDESLLTGESLPISKSMENPAAAGTTVTRGSGLIVIAETGPRTAIGRIAESATASPPRTPLQLRLDRFAGALLHWVGVVCLVLAGAAFAYGESLRASFLTGVSLAVAAVPEALPAIVTIALALGMRQLAQRGAIIRRLPAVETLGSASVICTDKTGTLTLNQLVLDRVWSCRSGREASSDAALLAAALLATDPHQAGSEQADPIERAIAEAARASGLTLADALGDGRLAAYEPFDPDLRRMGVTIDRGGEPTVYVKGAPEAVAELLDRPPAAEAAAEVAEHWAADGSRVLMLASGDSWDSLRPLGLLRFTDPPRASARASVEEARRAGIRTVMVTGDHPGTASAVARATGIVRQDGPVEVVTGAQLAGLSDDELANALTRAAVFARVAPGQKLRLVRLLSERGEVVAMTGDGVNDVPALRAAHIGVAMGRGGSDAASAAADVVLTDDDYGTIVRAVRAGRAIFDDIRHFTLFLLAANLGEVIVFALAVGAGLSAPLTVLQILLVNLLTDGLPAVALAADPPERDVMNRPPRPLAEGLLEGARGRLAVAGAAVGIAGFAAFLIGRAHGLETGRTLAFTTLVAAQLLFVYSARTSGPCWTAARNRLLHLAVAVSALSAGALLWVPALRGTFEMSTVSSGQLLTALGLAMLPLIASELYKARRRARFRSSSAPEAVPSPIAHAVRPSHDRYAARGAQMTTVTNWLDEYGVDYELIEHPEAFTALDEARAAAQPPQHAAKTVLLRHRGRYRIALIPARRHLDLDRARQLFGDTKHLRLATEAEMAADFPALEVGALPPFGPLLAAPEIVDSRLLQHDRILCSAGDHRHLLALDPDDLIRATDPLIGDICEHRPSPHDEDFAERPQL